MKPFDSLVHAKVIRHFLDYGFAPDVAALADQCACSEDIIRGSLGILQQEHGLILHPDSDRIWVAHPFATQSTNFWITSGRQSWWGNCIWCALGVAALVQKDIVIETRIGGEIKPVSIHITDGELVDENLFGHFTTPLRQVWDNPHFYCATALVFENESQVDDWCARHALNKGAVVPVVQIWDLAKVWYANHASPSWEKPTVGEVNAIFKSVGLIDDFWQLVEKEGTF